MYQCHGTQNLLVMSLKKINSSLFFGKLLTYTLCLLFVFGCSCLVVNEGLLAGSVSIDIMWSMLGRQHV